MSKPKAFSCGDSSDCKDVAKERREKREEKERRKKKMIEDGISEYV